METPLPAPTAAPLDRRPLYVLGGTLLALAPVAVYARLGTVVLLIATLIAQPCWDRCMANLRWLARNTLVRIALVFAAWTLISLLWTPQPNLLTWARIALVPVMGGLFIAAVGNLSTEESQRLTRLTMMAGLTMLALLAMEVFSHGAIFRFVVPDPGPIPPEQTSPVFEAASRGCAVLAPLAFAFAYVIYTETRRALLAVAFIGLALVTCFSSSMDAAWVAIAAGSIAFIVTRFAPRFALIGFCVGLSLYAIAAPLIHAQLSLEGMHDIKDQPWVGMESRVGIWHYAAGLIAEQPIIGHGFDSTRVLALSATNIPGTPWPSLPLHTHNNVLQIWLELGGVGIALTIAFFVAAARALWPLTQRPIQLGISLATITSTCVIALISFGIWQHWWLAVWMFAGALTRLALRARS